MFLTSLLAEIGPADVYYRQWYTIAIQFFTICILLWSIYKWHLAYAASQETNAEIRKLVSEVRSAIHKQDYINEVVLEISQASHTVTQSAAREVLSSSEKIVTTGEEISERITNTGEEIKDSVPAVAEQAAESAVRKMVENQTNPRGESK